MFADTGIYKQPPVLYTASSTHGRRVDNAKAGTASCGELPVTLRSLCLALYVETFRLLTTVLTTLDYKRQKAHVSKNTL